jgi:hypothetical protein
MTLTFNASTQMMENHIPASVMYVQPGFKAATGSTGDTFIISLGADGVCRICAMPSGGGQWVVLDISADFSEPNTTITGFTIAADPASKSLTVCAVIRSPNTGQGQSGFSDTLLVLSGLPDQAASGWMQSGGSRPWVSVGYDGGGSTFDNGNLSIASVVLDYGVSPSIFVNLNNPATGKITPFAVSTRQIPNWVAVGLDFQSTSLNSLVPGNPSGTSPGLYALSTNNDTSTVYFQAVPSTGTVTSFGLPNWPTQPSAIAAIPTGAGTSIFVAYPSSGSTPATIALFPRTSHAAIQVLTGVMVDNIIQLHAVFDGTSYHLWGLGAGSQGTSQVFYASTAMADVAQPWSAPTLLASGVTAIAPAVDDSSGVVSLFALTDPSTGQVGRTRHRKGGAGAAPTAPFITHMQRSADTGYWGMTPLAPPASQGYVRLTSNTTRVLVTDENNIPQPNIAVTVSTGSDVSLIVNGAYQTFLGCTPTSVQTDGAGAVVFMETLSTAAPTSMQFSDPNAPTSASPTALDASAQVTAQVTAGAVNPSQIQMKNNQGTSTPLLASVSEASMASITSSFNGVNTLLTGGSPLQSRPVSSATGRTRATLGFSFSHLLGDLVQLATSAADDVEDAAISLVDGAEDVYQLVVTIAGEIYNAEIQFVEDAISAIGAIIQSVISDFEELFQWLAFLFNWSDITNSQAAIASSFGAFARGLVGEGDAICATVSGWVGKVQLNLSANSGQVNGVGGNVNSNYSSNYGSGPTVGGANMATNPTMGWTQQQVTASASAAGPGAPTAVRRRHAETMNGASSSFPATTAMLTGFGTVNSSANNGAANLPTNGLVNSSSSSPGDVEGALAAFLSTLATDVAEVVLDGVQDLLTGSNGQPAPIAAALDELLASVDELLTAEIDIPIFSALFQDVVEAPATGVNIAAFCQAVIFTLSYKIATGNSPSGLADALGSGFASATTWLTTGQAPTAARSLGDAAMETSLIMEGALCITESIVNFVEVLLVEGNTSDEEVSTGSVLLAFVGMLGNCISSVLELAAADDDGDAWLPGISALLSSGCLFGMLAQIVSAATVSGAVQQSNMNAAIVMSSWVTTFLGELEIIGLLVEDQAFGGEYLTAFADTLSGPGVLFAESQATANIAIGISAVILIAGIIGGALQIADAVENQAAAA